jgi:hypothetical protein
LQVQSPCLEEILNKKFLKKKKEVYGELQVQSPCLEEILNKKFLKKKKGGLWRRPAASIVTLALQ